MTALRRVAAGLLALCLGTGVLLVVPPAGAAPARPAVQSGLVPVMLVVDTSGSMADPDPNGTIKIEGAKTALLQLLDALPVGSEIGMRTYPAGGPDCGTGAETVPLAVRDPSGMSAQVRALTADGGTPTAEALQAAADDLRADSIRAATIVLVSDGESTCGDPCEVARELTRDGFDVTVNTVGFQIDAAGAEELRCVAQATGGQYRDVDDSAALAAELSASQAPSLDLDLSYAQQFSPADSAELDITATVRNESDVTAADVRLSLVFDVGASAGSPTVLQPLRTLGNVAGGETAEVRWTVYPALSSDQQQGQLEFAVTLTSRYVTPVVAQGTVTLEPVSLADAAPWLRDARGVVVLGDSYSSGEGSGDYLDDQDGTSGCHRSDNTYAEALFAGSGTEVTNLACSGAVVEDYYLPQHDREVEAQQDQLADQDDYDTVLLTMGGNDIGFAEIIQNCVLGGECSGAARCSSWLADKVLGCEGAAAYAPDQWQRRLEGLHDSLVRWYEDVLDDTGDATVVVLPYVHVVPDGDVTTGCQGTNALGRDFDSTELRLIQWLQDQLDAQIADAVADADADAGRLLFAGDVGSALQPAHTLCSQDRWVVGLGDRGIDAFTPASKDQKQELVHPTADGYAAIARSLVRWSGTVTPAEPEPDDGTVFTWFTDRAADVVGGVSTLFAGSTEVDLQDAADPLEVRAGETVTVSTAGYAPGSQVVIVVRSLPRALAGVTADEQGRVTATVVLPDDLPTGEHALTAEGFTTDGEYLLTGTALDLGRPAPWGVLVVGGAGLLVALSGAWLVRRSRRVPA